MKVFVYTKSGSCLNNEDWEFTFHGLELEERIEHFMMEESYLSCKRKTNMRKYKYIPFHDIAQIEEVEG